MKSRSNISYETAMSAISRITSVAFLCYAFPCPPIARYRPYMLSSMHEHRGNALRVYNQDTVSFSATYSAAPVHLVQHQRVRLLANAGKNSPFFLFIYIYLHKFASLPLPLTPIQASLALFAFACVPEQDLGCTTGLKQNSDSSGRGNFFFFCL